MRAENSDLGQRMRSNEAQCVRSWGRQERHLIIHSSKEEKFLFIFHYLGSVLVMNSIHIWRDSGLSARRANLTGSLLQAVHQTNGDFLLTLFISCGFLTRERKIPSP